MKIAPLLILLVISQLALSQEAEFKGECCDDTGKPLNPSSFENQMYSVKKHKKKTAFELDIRSVKLGDQVLNVAVSFKENVESETPLILINDTVSIKFVLARTTQFKANRYIYNFLIFKKDVESECWRSINSMNNWYDVYDQTINLGLFSFGNENSRNFFQIREGWIKLD